ncbi:hypothetical protein [Micromonospora sp. CPCC 206061]|uniref:hypothetical protein n=1 Tax=Micromonospora sp. CPCC 206061 TaxID=3122410 RepID=UPI002FF20EC8
MRHVGSLLLALVLAPLAWVLTGIGLMKYSDVRVQFEAGLRVELLLGLLALLAAGALYAVLVLARLSPIGPTLAGAGYLGAAVWYGVAPASFLDVFPYEVGDVDVGLPIPAAGFSAVLAVPLLATLMSPRRWRRHDRPAATPAGAVPYPVPPGAPYGPPGSPYGPPPGYPAPPHPGAGVPVPAGGLGMSSPAPTMTAFPAASYPPAGSPAAPTTAFSPVPEAAPVAPQSPPPPPVSAPPKPAAAEPTTTVLASEASANLGDDPPTTRLDTEATQLVKGPPPPEAYPRPAWSAPTPPPITPPKPAGTDVEDDDPEATQRYG